MFVGKSGFSFRLSKPVAKWSYSQLQAYRTCPAQWKAVRMDKRAAHDKRRALPGTLVHAVVQRLFEHKLGAYADARVAMAYLDAYAHVTLSELATREGVVLTAYEVKQALDLVHDVLPGIFRTLDHYRLYGGMNRVEYGLSVQLEADTVFGTADLIVEHPDSTMILDVKSGKTVGRYVSVEQLQFYALGYLREFERLPNLLGFWWVRHEKVLWKKLGDLSLLREGLQATIDRIRANDFAPTPGRHCQLCPIKMTCEASPCRKQADIEIPAGNCGRISLDPV
jgi:hypothetical protein